MTNRDILKFKILKYRNLTYLDSLSSFIKFNLDVMDIDKLPYNPQLKFSHFEMSV